MNVIIRDPGSALTHYIAMMLSMFAATPLLIKAALSGNPISFTAMSVFIISMILLYGASTLYHTVNVSAKALKIFRKVDHMMIFVLIAGSYTPVCLIVLKEKLGLYLMWLVWGIALLGFILNIFWINCPKWISSVIYISMGWVCIGVFGPLWSILPHAAFMWLLIGGILYTIGGVLYALKIPIFHNRFRYFGIHELFHVFVMAGSFCHFIFMYNYVI